MEHRILRSGPQIWPEECRYNSITLHDSAMFFFFNTQRMSHLSAETTARSAAVFSSSSKIRLTVSVKTVRTADLPPWSDRLEILRFVGGVGALGVWPTG